MSDRKYNVAEIDRMRGVLTRRHPFQYQAGDYIRPKEDKVLQAGRIEDILRTYMLNGTDPEELEKAAS